MPTPIGGLKAIPKELRKCNIPWATTRILSNISWPRIRGGAFDQLLFTTVRQTPRENEDLEVLWHLWQSTSVHTPARVSTSDGKNMQLIIWPKQ
jgi:hypothetical protein